MTNLVAAIVTVTVATNTVLLSLHPSGVERHVQDVIETRHIYNIGGTNFFTNVVSVVSNPPVREVWSREPLVRQPFGSVDQSFPFPPGYVSVEEAMRLTSTNQVDHDPMTNVPPEIMPPR